MEAFNWPTRTVRAILVGWLAVSTTAMAGYLLVTQPDGDLTKTVVLGIAAVFDFAAGYYFGSSKPVPSA